MTISLDDLTQMIQVDAQGPWTDDEVAIYHEALENKSANWEAVLAGEITWGDWVRVDGYLHRVIQKVYRQGGLVEITYRRGWGSPLSNKVKVMVCAGHEPLLRLADMY